MFIGYLSLFGGQFGVLAEDICLPCMIPVDFLVLCVCIYIYIYFFSWSYIAGQMSTYLVLKL